MAVPRLLATSSCHVFSPRLLATSSLTWGRLANLCFQLGPDHAHNRMRGECDGHHALHVLKYGESGGACTGAQDAEAAEAAAAEAAELAAALCVAASAPLTAAATCIATTCTAASCTAATRDAASCAAPAAEHSQLALQQVLDQRSNRLAETVDQRRDEPPRRQGDAAVEGRAQREGAVDGFADMRRGLIELILRRWVVGGGWWRVGRSRGEHAGRREIE